MCALLGCDSAAVLEVTARERHQALPRIARRTRLMMSAATNAAR
jgi:hypothetical protein